MTTDARAALAAALEAQHEAFLAEPESFDSRDAIAAFLLAAMPNAVPTLTAWRREFELDHILRLGAPGEASPEIERLRAALRQIAMTPKAHKLVASICEIALEPTEEER